MVIQPRYHTPAGQSVSRLHSPLSGSCSFDASLPSTFPVPFRVLLLALQTLSHPALPSPCFFSLHAISFPCFCLTCALAAEPEDAVRKRILFEGIPDHAGRARLCTPNMTLWKTFIRTAGRKAFRCSLPIGKAARKRPNPLSGVSVHFRLSGCACGRSPAPASSRHPGQAP